MLLSTTFAFSCRKTNRKFLRYLLVTFWILGILLGGMAARYAPNMIYSMMRMLPGKRMTIVGGVLVGLFPLVATAIVLYFMKPWFCIPVAFCKAVAFGFVSGCFYLAFPAAGWLLRLLFCFSSSCNNILLLWLWLRMLSDGKDFGGKQLMVTAFWMAVVFCIDCCFVSPFGAMLYEFW